MKAQHYDLSIADRTSLGSKHGGSRSKTFGIPEHGDYAGEAGFWVEDEEGAKGFYPSDSVLAAGRPLQSRKGQERQGQAPKRPLPTFQETTIRLQGQHGR